MMELVDTAMSERKARVCDDAGEMDAERTFSKQHWTNWRCAAWNVTLYNRQMSQS